MTHMDCRRQLISTNTWGYSGWVWRVCSCQCSKSERMLLCGSGEQQHWWQCCGSTAGRYRNQEHVSTLYSTTAVSDSRHGLVWVGLEPRCRATHKQPVMQGNSCPSTNSIAYPPAHIRILPCQSARVIPYKKRGGGCPCRRPKVLHAR